MPLLLPLLPARAAVWALCVASALASGCAHVQVDETGRTHVRGLVWLTLPAPADAAQALQAGQGLRLRTLGLSWFQAEVGSSLVLGWQDSTLTYLLDHRLVDARAALSAPARVSATTAALCAAPTGALP